MEEPALMMKTALALLTIAALGGVAMAGIRFGRNVNPPSWLAMLHGLLAGAALTLLLYAHFTVGLPAHADWALLIFLVAAAGGAFLNLAYHAKGQPLSTSIVLVHASVAVVGYILLAMTVFGIQ
jgi:drug/metabolite transporter (DMT)-like permease